MGLVWRITSAVVRLKKKGPYIYILYILYFIYLYIYYIEICPLLTCGGYHAPSVMDIPGSAARGQGLHSLFQHKRLLKLVIAAKKTGSCPMQEMKPESTQPQKPILFGEKKCPNLVNDLLLRCGAQRVTSEGPALPLCLPTISRLSYYVIAREKHPFFTQQRSGMPLEPSTLQGLQADSCPQTEGQGYSLTRGFLCLSRMT